MDRLIPQNLRTRPHSHDRSEHLTKRQVVNHLEDEHAHWLAGGTYREIIEAHMEHHPELRGGK